MGIKISITIIVFASIVWISSIIMDYSIVVPLSKPAPSQRYKLEKGDIFNPLKNYDFGKGRWTAYLIISRTDFSDLPPALKKGRYLKTTDIELLRQIRDVWKFVYTGGDVGTVESVIYFINDDKIVFQSGIVVDKERVGLQDKTYGWLEASDGLAIVECLQRFKKIDFPIVLL